jgi:hypothetical protein
MDRALLIALSVAFGPPLLLVAIAKIVDVANEKGPTRPGGTVTGVVPPGVRHRPSSCVPGDALIDCSVLADVQARARAIVLHRLGGDICNDHADGTLAMHHDELADEELENIALRMTVWIYVDGRSWDYVRWAVDKLANATEDETDWTEQA